MTVSEVLMFIYDYVPFTGGPRHISEIYDTLKAAPPTSEVIVRTEGEIVEARPVNERGQLLIHLLDRNG
jgi:hypothetical protein